MRGAVTNGFAAMPEQEARAKWCPYTFASLVDAGQSDEEIVASKRCAGSDCMGWRWCFEPVHDGAGAIHRTKPTAKGYCGMAGPL